MMKPKHGHGKAKGMPKPPAGSGAGPMPQGAPSAAGKAGGAIGFKAPSSVKGFGHPTPQVKPLTTDRGAFKIKG